MGWNLEALAQEQRKKKMAVQTLSAQIRTWYVQHTWAQRRSLATALHVVLQRELERAIYPPKHCTFWMFGGPYYSFPSNKDTYKKGRGQMMCKYRHGHNQETLRELQRIMDLRAYAYPRLHA